MVSAPPILSVPVPLSVPARISATFKNGSSPIGNVQSLLMVFVDALEKVIRLNVTLLQAKVPLPSKSIVPPFALKVGEFEIVILEATVIVPLEAVKLPPEMLNAPLRSALEPSATDPELRVNVLEKVDDVPSVAAPPLTVKPAKLALAGPVNVPALTVVVPFTENGE